MFEHLDTPQDLFTYKLGAALSMEHDSLEMLEDLKQHAQRAELKNLFEEHAEETRHQISNLERCFELMGKDVDKNACPTTEGLKLEGKSTMTMAEPGLMDGIVLGGGLETERYEIAVYETLITMAEAHSMTEIVGLLRENLGQEVAASDKIKQAAEHVAKETAAAA